VTLSRSQASKQSSRELHKLLSSPSSLQVCLDTLGSVDHDLS
jgi:hypothetical protein